MALYRLMMIASYKLRSLIKSTFKIEVKIFKADNKVCADSYVAQTYITFTFEGIFKRLVDTVTVIINFIAVVSLNYIIIIGFIQRGHKQVEGHQFQKRGWTEGIK